MTRIVAQGILVGIEETDAKIRGPPALMVAIEDLGVEHLERVGKRAVEVYTVGNCPYNLDTANISEEIVEVIRSEESKLLKSAPSEWLRRHIVEESCVIERYVHSYIGEEDYEFEIYGPPEQTKRVGQCLCTLFSRYPFRVFEQP
jgi:hypothetical protein